MLVEIFPITFGKRTPARPNAKVDRVITLPEAWHHKPHRQQLTYFIPEWDDLVDGAFDGVPPDSAGRRC